MAEESPVVDNQIIQALHKFEINYSLYAHPDFRTCSLSSAWHKAQNKLGRRVKNLFLRNKNGKQHFLLLLPHEIEFDKAVFKSHSKQKCGLASDERLWHYLKVKPGSVSPFNTLYDTNHEVTVFIEKTLIETEALHFHVGSPESSVSVSPNHLILFLQSQSQPFVVFDWFSPKTHD